MKTHTTALAVLLLVLPNPLAAQTTWEIHTRTGEYAFAAGNMERAEEEFLAALTIAQELPPPDRRLETSLGNLARFYEHQERFEQALPMYQLLVAAAESRLGEDDPALLTPLLGTGRVALQTGDVPTAEDSLQHYRAIADATGEAAPEQHWVALAILARMCTLQERDEEALEYQREAVAVLEEAHGPTELERATALESLAQMELLHGTADHAEELLVRAAELRTADEEGGSITVMLTAAASTAFGAGALDVAQRLGERALAAAPEEGQDLLPVKEVLADVAWMRVRRGTDNLGDLYLGASPGPELDDAYDRLMEIHGATDPTTDSEVTRDNLSRLAQVGALRGEVADSAHWQRLLIDLERELTGTDSAQVMAAQENLIGLFNAAGAVDQALTANTWLIATQEEAWGTNSQRLRPALERQLELLTEAGLKKQAKAVKKRLKKLR
jgi:tetratricopeptide (TPR) repeat protein